MTERKLTTVQCFDDTKEKFDRAAEVLRWKLPLVMELLGDALDVMVAEEESVEQRKQRMLAKLGAAATNVRQRSNRNLTPVSQESNNGSEPVVVAS